MRSLKKIIYSLIIIFSLLSVFSNNRNIQNNEVHFTSTEGWFFNEKSVLSEDTDYSQPSDPDEGTFLMRGYFYLTVPEWNNWQKKGTIKWMQGDTVLAEQGVDCRGVSNGHASFFNFYFNGPPGIYSGTNFIYELENGITIGGEPGDNSWIDDFRVGKHPTLKRPTFNDYPTIEVNEDNTLTVNYDINIPSVDEYTEATVINKIEITDGQKVFGSIDSSTIEGGIIPPTGLITTYTSLDSGDYSNLYLKVTYNNNLTIGGVDGDNSQIPSFTIEKSSALAPEFIESPTIDIDPDTKVGTVNYNISIPPGDAQTEATLVTKIEVMNGSTSIANTTSVSNGAGTITTPAFPVGVYNGLYLKVTYNNNLTIGGVDGDNSQIPSFTIEKSSALAPEFIESPTIDIDPDTKVGTVNYNISIPPGDAQTEATLVTKIEVMNGSTSIANTTSVSNGAGTITTPAFPVGVYNGLYLKATYNDGSTIGGVDGDNSQIPSFTIEKSSAEAPIFNNYPTIEINEDNTLTVNYDIAIPSGDDYTEATVVTKIEITDGQKVFGSIDSSTIEGGIIPPTGSITTNIYLESGIYSGLYLKATYNNGLTIGGVDGDKSQIEDFTITKEPALAPKINSVEITEIKHSKAIVKYNIDIPTGQSTVEDTVVQKIEVIDNKDGKIYGSIEVKSKSEVSSIEEIGEIELQGLDSKTVYNELYLSITYNGNEGMPIGSIEDSHIVPFTTKVNWTIIYGSIIALSIILILIIIILLVLDRRKKFKIEKKYHIQKK